MSVTTRAPGESRRVRGMGRIFVRGGIYWIAYYFNGKEDSRDFAVVKRY